MRLAHTPGPLLRSRLRRDLCDAPWREKSRQNGESTERFTKDTADKTGMSERTAQRGYRDRPA
jgi:hypothetical protein